MDKRNVVLQKIQNALKNPSPAPQEPDWTSPVFANSGLSLLEQYCAAARAVQTEVHLCASAKEANQAIQAYIALQEKPQVILSTEAEAMLGSIEGAYLQQVDRNLPADIGISTAECLCARTGSMFVSSASAGSRTIGVYPHEHIVVAFQNQIVEDIEQGFAEIRNKYTKEIPSLLSLVSGPSRTADIEKTLVLGAHGPKKLIVYLIQHAHS
jgi:L-lactate dehydrogenase complex protein LldG